MAIVKDYLDPNAAAYTDDEIVGKVNAATANITRANALAEAGLPAETATFKKFSGTEQTKLTGIEDSATADQTGAEVRDAIVALADDDRKIVISRPTTGQFKVYAIQRHTDGKSEVERSDTAEV